MTASTFAELDTARAAPHRNARFGGEFALYFACSLLALAADFGLYSAGLKLGLGYPTAAATGFIVGLWVAYTLSVRYVFSTRSVANPRLEFILFAAIGMLGLLLTEALLWLLIGRHAVHALLAKVITSGLVFCFNFGVRKFVLFTGRREANLA